MNLLQHYSELWKNWKQSKYSSIESWQNELGYIGIVEYYTAVRKNKVDTRAELTVVNNNRWPIRKDAGFNYMMILVRDSYYGISNKKIDEQLIWILIKYEWGRYT